MGASGIDRKTPGALAMTATLGPDVVEVIAQRAAEIVAGRMGARRPDAGPYLTVAEGAALIRARPQRIYDLVSSSRLRRYKDGTRLLISRAELEAYLAGTGTRSVPGQDPAARGGRRRAAPLRPPGPRSRAPADRRG